MPDRSWMLEALGLTQILDAAGVEMPLRRSMKVTGQTAVNGDLATTIPAPTAGATGDKGPDGPGGAEPPGATGSGVTPTVVFTELTAGSSHTFTGSFGLVIVVGGGGGGGGIRTAQALGAAASGGGAGGTVVYFYDTFPASGSYTLGNGGLSGINTTAGGNGTDSTWTSTGGVSLTAGGGQGGDVSSSSDSTTNQRLSPRSGFTSDGGTATGGHINIPGQGGTRGRYGEAILGGSGGNSSFGGAGRQVTGDSDGEDGQSYGAGGGGASSDTAVGDIGDGGLGIEGVIFVVEFD